MTDEPDFRALAELWLSRDPRSSSLDESAREKALSRLTESLRQRRQSVSQTDAQELGLIVNVPREMFSPQDGLSEPAMEQLTRIIKERIEDLEDSTSSGDQV